MTPSKTVMAMGIPALGSLIELYGESAEVDVPELINLTARAILSGNDYTYAVRVHGSHTDVDQTLLLRYMKDIYDSIVMQFTDHAYSYIYEIDVMAVRRNQIVLLLEL